MILYSEHIYFSEIFVGTARRRMEFEFKITESAMA